MSQFKFNPFSGQLDLVNVTELVEDLSPQLGGDLDVNGFSIISVGGGDIAITPDGAGQVVIDGERWPIADGAPGQVLKTDGAANLSWQNDLNGIGAVVDDLTPQLGGDLDVNGNSIVSVAGGDIVITPNGAGQIILDGERWPVADGAPGQVIKTDGAGNLSWQNDLTGIGAVVDDLTPQLGGNLDVNGRSIVSVAGGDIVILPDGAGQIILDGEQWPIADGAAGQCLVTDGATNLGFATRLANVVEDTTPQLGGNLDVNGNSIVSVAGGDINITPNGAGQVVIDGEQWPIADGTANQVLTTDGATNLSWSDASRCIITLYSANATHTLNTKTKLVDIKLYSGGGGGGSGRRGQAGTDRYGGGGGSAGTFTTTTLDATLLNPSLIITIAGGGTGGIAQTVDDNDGLDGNIGGQSSIDSKMYTNSIANSGGKKGTAVSGTGGSQSSYWFNLWASATAVSSSAGIAGSNLTPGSASSSFEGPTSGGGGGGVNAANTVGGGGRGKDLIIQNGATLIFGGTGGLGGGGAGGNGVNGFIAGSYTRSGGIGGGGGGPSKTTNAGAGGNGGWPGGGGGGGGGSFNGFNSGAGGIGGDGGVIVVEWL